MGDMARILAEVAGLLEKVERNVERLRGRVKQLQELEKNNTPQTLEGQRLSKPSS